MRKALGALFAAAALAAGLASCASLDKPFAKVQVYAIDEVPDAGAAILSYPGSSFLTINLYKVDGVAKREPYYLSFPASYTQFKTVGFGLKLYPGEHSIEIMNLKRNEIVKISADLGAGRYILQVTKEGYEIVREGEDEKVAIKVEAVPAYDVAAPGAAVLRLPKLVEDKPMVFRINGMRPQVLDKNMIAGQYTFSDTKSEVEIPLREGENVIEYMTYENSMTMYNSFLILNHSIVFKAEPGKAYTIARPAPDQNNQVIAVE